ncbi:ATP-binding protein [Catenovulum sp. 2E275]|uniref:ATP-binding protein n=1 Tax=Catenovulum sp. 2E275 TaxID=2980497 RepID=UPI0021CE4A52|nr:ATP-binding protein [Catenovulum sp. 2E275]MCU4674969.1 ATP-binding protein [Catenovulum sp. 2E275]
MTRLFISLYLIIVCGLFLIGWGAEQTWKMLTQQTTTESEVTDNLNLKLLPLAITKFESEQALSQALANALNTQVRVIETQDILLPQAQFSALKQGQSIPTYTQQNALIIYHYWPLKHKVIEIGPLTLSQNNQTLNWLLRSLSYLVLALVIAAWVWPLWRDLNALQTASKAYAKGQFEFSPEVKKTSAIYPLASSFEKMAAQISQLIDEQKQLVNAVSHDLRTPLSRIKFSLNMLPQTTLTQLPDVQQDLAELEKLIEELLSYARLENQSQGLNLDYVDLNELICHQADKFNQFTDKKIITEINQTLIWLCDGWLIERCLDNLLSNAVRYAKNTIIVQAQIVNKQLIIRVEDDGEGIDPLQYQQIFKPFTRLETSRNKQSAGFGLGLAIVDKICQWHQGQCCVSASSAGGAKFTLYLADLTDSSNLTP